MTADLQVDSTVTIEFHPTERRGVFRVSASHPSMPTFTDEVRVHKAEERERFITALRERAPALDVEEIRRKMDELAASVGSARAAAPAPPGAAPTREQLLEAHDAEVDSALDGMPEGVVDDAQTFLRDPDLVDRLLADVQSQGVVGESELALTSYLLGTSRLLAKPLSAIVQGLSSSGKSFVPDAVSRLFPPEAVVRATDITPQALYYMPTGGLMHRFVVAGERPRVVNDERAEATRALREMLSAGELRKVVTVKVGGVMQSQTIWQPGPIAFIESTTATRLFDEDANRSLLLATDESPEQTRRIVEQQALRADVASVDQSPLVSKHHAVQRLLRRVRVRIPFAPAIARAVPTQRQEARRAMTHILSMISAVALLHQFQRASGPPRHGGTILASLHDYVIARRLLTGPLGRSLGGSLTPAVVRFGRRLRDAHGTANFTSTQAASGDPAIHSKSKANDYLRALADEGVAECIAESRGSIPSVWRIVAVIPDGGSMWLPMVEELEGYAHG